jgi:hypothetical protein
MNRNNTSTCTTARYYGTRFYCPVCDCSLDRNEEMSYVIRNGQSLPISILWCHHCDTIFRDPDCCNTTTFELNVPLLLQLLDYDSGWRKYEE